MVTSEAGAERNGEEIAVLPHNNALGVCIVTWSGQTLFAPSVAEKPTILDRNGPVIAKIKKGEAYYGDADILGKLYVTGYEPIKDASANASTMSAIKSSGSQSGSPTHHAVRTVSSNRFTL